MTLTRRLELACRHIRRWWPFVTKKEFLRVCKVYDDKSRQDDATIERMYQEIRDAQKNDDALSALIGPLLRYRVTRSGFYYKITTAIDAELMNVYGDDVLGNPTIVELLAEHVGRQIAHEMKLLQWKRLHTDGATASKDGTKWTYPEP